MVTVGSCSRMPAWIPSVTVACDIGVVWCGVVSVLLFSVGESFDVALVHAVRACAVDVDDELTVRAGDCAVREVVDHLPSHAPAADLERDAVVAPETHVVSTSCASGDSAADGRLGRFAEAVVDVFAVAATAECLLRECHPVESNTFLFERLNRVLDQLAESLT